MQSVQFTLWKRTGEPGHMTENAGKHLLHSNADSTTPRERNEISGKVVSSFSRLNPSLGVEASWIREDGWVSVDKITNRADRGLADNSVS